MSNHNSPLKAIREKCLDCCCGNAAEVKRCELEKCPLHPFRMGTNPNHKKNLTDEQRAALSERAKTLRAAQLAEKNGG